MGLFRIPAAWLRQKTPVSIAILAPRVFAMCDMEQRIPGRARLRTVLWR